MAVSATWSAARRLADEVRHARGVDDVYLDVVELDETERAAD
jgi:hypothetical protein